MKKSFLLMAFALLAALTVSSVTLAQQKPDAQVRQAARSWLALVDTGKYAQSWDSASAEFKVKVTQEKWKSMLDQVRAPLGNIESRAFKTAAEADNPPNSPPGKYEVLQYATNYANQPSARETVALIREKDGKWRVAGYFINLPPK